MDRWYDLTGVAPGFERAVVTVGVFDGVHRGHQRLLGRAVQRARAVGGPVIVVTFDPHPMSVVRPDAVPPMLATLERRLELLEQYGADAVVVLPFTRDRSRQPAEEFVREVVGALNPAAFVIGDDFRFGFKAAGDVGLLRTLGAELGFEVESLNRGDTDPQWSSSAVRERLAAGDVAAATELLGHAFQIEGTVVEGADRGGRMLGFPTANVFVDESLMCPADGVYAGWLRRRDQADPERLPDAISVGTNPQFGAEARRVESHVVDRDDLELYDVPVAVEFVQRLRGQETFETLEGLIDRMRRDVDQVRSLLPA